MHPDCIKYLLPSSLFSILRNFKKASVQQKNNKYSSFYYIAENNKLLDTRKS